MNTFFGKHSYFLATPLVVLAVAYACVMSSSALAQESQRTEGSSTFGSGQSEATKGLEQITVTARKRSESLQDVPVAVSAITKTDLQNNAVHDLAHVGELAPQVSIGRGITGTGALLTIRGISSSSVDSGLDQSVTVSIDGVSLSRGRVIHAAQFDLQQVEVMQGPQSLFFGKNSPAGVISLTTVDPTDSLEGYVKAGYEIEAEEKYIDAAISGPAADTLKARLAFHGNWMNGWIKNIAPAQANPFNPSVPLPGAVGQGIGPKGHNLSGRLTLLWEPADDFYAKFKLTMSRARMNANDGYAEPYCLNSTAVPVILGVPSPNADCAANRVKAQSNLPAQYAVNYPYGNGGVPYQRSSLGLASLTLEKKFGDITLASTTGYYDQAHKGGYGGGNDEFASIWSTEAERYRLINEELRLNTDFSGSLNFMAGGYFEHSHRRWANVPNVLNVFNPVVGNYATTFNTSLVDNDSYSIFGQIRWKIVPSLEFAGGVRYTHDVKKSALLILYNNLASGTGRAQYPQGQVLNARYTNNNVSPDVTLTWKPDRDQTLYAAYKTGYKAGGISNSSLLPAAATSTNVLFGPEKVKGFEVGYKAEFFANTLRMDVTAYRYNYNGLQVTALAPAEFRYILRNAAKARTTGIGGSFTWLATDRLSFNGNIGYNRARYLSFPNSQCYTGQTAALGCVGGNQDLKGIALNRAPDVTFKLGADYRADLVRGWIADLSVSAAYSSSYQTSTDNAPAGIQKSYWLLNAAVHISPESEKYQLSLIGRNLTNSYYKVFSHQQALGLPGQMGGYFNRPREIVLQAAYNF